MFCVQQHMARSLHYDLRLEHDGVLLSWAVPRGPSLNPKDKRRAVRTEDHPIDYGDFEGVIPEGYGAGIVLLWDRGTWRCENPPVEEALEKGEIKFSVEGIKLKGSWVLVRTSKAGEKEKQEQWLLIKHRDAWSGEVDVTTLADQSVKSWGGLSDVLAEHGEAGLWSKSPPVRSGETAERFREVIREAAKKRQEAPGRAAPKKPAASTVPPAALVLGAKRPRLSNLDKPLYPSGFTKAQVIDYYTRIAPTILPHLYGRAVTLKRYPDGATGESFFEKRCPSHRPEWVQTAHIEHKSGKRLDYCLINDLSTLLWAANLAALELHVPLALAAAPETPTAMVFDMDPGEPATMTDCIDIGLRLRDMLGGLGLQCWAKLSGKKGLHVLVPLNTVGITFDQTKRFSKAIALLLQRQDPARITATMAKSQRPGKVYVDWAQNDVRKTTVCAWSLRAADIPSISAAMPWTTLEKAKPADLVVRADKPLRIPEQDVDPLLRQQLPAI